MPLDSTPELNEAGHVAAHQALHADYNAREGVAFATSADLVTAEDALEAADASHVAHLDPHAPAGYPIMIGGGRRIFVQSTTPTGAVNGDLWVDTTGL